MDKYIHDESNGLWYELQGDYYIPCLTMSYVTASNDGSVEGAFSCKIQVY